MRKRNFNGIIYPILFFLLPAVDGVLLAQDVAFVASVSVNKVAQHSVIEVRFELRNASGSDFRPPSFSGFRVVGGPSTGSSTMIVNGAVSSSQSWSYSLLASEQGQFTIGPASIIVGRQKLKTRPLDIKVTAPRDYPANGSTANPGETVILRAETDSDHYYPGQQIILTYRLLFTESVQTVSTLKEDAYTDFFIQNFSEFSREATYETINGVQYTSRIVRSLALFAHQSGTYTIDPMVMSAGINAPFPGNQGFFSMRRIRDIQVASAPLTINIMPLPQNAPASFSGAVGQYKIHITPENTQITTDDAFSFQVEIAGNGDSRRWDAPYPVTDGDFETYEPKIIEDNAVDAGNQVSATRTIGYQIIPAAPGEYKVYVPLTYFDPGIKEYVTISTDTIKLHVKPGTGNPVSALSRNAPPSAVPELMPVRTVYLMDRFWVSIPHLVLFSILLTGSGFSMFYGFKRRRESRLSTSEKTRINAGPQARIRYDFIESALASMPSGEFFEKATEAYYKFLIDRFTIPSSELDEVNLRSYMKEAGVSDEHVSRATSFFTQCLTVRYGGIPGGMTREAMLLECRSLTDILEGER